VRAADRADTAFAFDRAAQLYRMALDLRPPDHRSVPELLVKLGDALSKAGRGAEAAEVYTRAAAGAPASEALDLRRQAVTQSFKCGHLDEGLAAVEALSDATGLRLPRTPRAALVALGWRRALIRLRGYGFHLRDPGQVPAEQLRLLDFCSWVASVLTTTDAVRGNALSAQVVLAALRLGEPVRLARVLAMEAIFVSLGPSRSRARPTSRSKSGISRPRARRAGAACARSSPGSSGPAARGSTSPPTRTLTRPP
jgi:hypothetical protein